MSLKIVVLAKQVPDTRNVGRQSGISPLRADMKSRRGVSSEGTGADRNLLPKKTVLRVANTFMRHFF